jgi:phage/plasmid-associated DNA primase
MPHPATGETVQLSEGEIELLCGQWSYCPLGAEVFNSDAGIEELPGLSLMLESSKANDCHSEALESTYDIPPIFEAALQCGKATGVLSPNSRVFGQATRKMVKRKNGTIGTQWSVRVQRPGHEKCPNGHVHNSNRNSFLNVFENGDGFENEVQVVCLNDKSYAVADGAKTFKCAGLTQRIVVAYEAEGDSQTLDAYFCKYGISKEGKFNLSDKFFADRFMHSYGKQFIICEKTIYQQNKFGLYKKIAFSIHKIVIEFFSDFLSNSLAQMKTMGETITEAEKEGTKKERHVLWGQYKAHKSVVHRLSNSVPLSKIVAWIKNEVTNELYAEELDKNPHLLGCNNGVIDLRELSGDMTAVEAVRVAKPDEYVSMSVGYDFKWATEEECRPWMERFRMLYESQEEMDYDFKDLSRSLRGGGNPEEVAQFDWGPGGNGKGFKATAAHKALGQYCATLSSSCVEYSKYKKNNGHDIPLWTARKARLWLLSELDENAIVDMDQLKRYTGFDLIPVRTHNQQEMSYFYAPPIRFSINNVLQLKGSREASVIRRIRAKRHKQTFLGEEEYGKLDKDQRVNHHKLDSTLKNQMEQVKVKCILLTILLKYYKRFCKEGLIPPESIAQDTRRFLNESDDTKEWFDMNLVRDSACNLCKKDLLTYYNDENNTFKNMKWLNAKLKSYGYEIGASFTCYRLVKNQEEAWVLATKRKGTCVRGVKLKDVEIK